MLLLLTACTPTSAARNDPAPAERSVTLAWQQEATVDGLSVQFVGYRDSRCPADVTCVWAGEAHAFVWVSGPGMEPHVVSLPWNGGGAQRPQDANRIGARTLWLEALEPRPRTDGKVSPGDYRVVLKVGGVGAK
ncbi:hypothetical protein C0063_07955 [Pseudoxanthomonas sp. KAs_5_3]|nr:hypothetical protein C0063_07955 [Pseudoxanthomonas sp. KAs_5_3]